MIHYRTPTNNIYAYDTVEAAQPFIDPTWVLVEEHIARSIAVPPKTDAQQISLISLAICKELDNMAKSRQYDNIVTACAYASPVPFILTPGSSPTIITIISLQEKFRIEGNALQAWMSLTWATINQYLNTVTAGTNKMPTVDQAIAMIPKFTWPN